MPPIEMVGLIHTAPMFRRALVAVLLLAGCAQDSSPEQTGQPAPPAHAPPVTGSPRATDGSASKVAAEVRAAMTEFLAYSESVLAVVRQHGADCDLAAKQLESRAAVFRELGPRMMRVKQALEALPEPERERIKRQSEQSMEAFKSRNPDAEAIEQKAKACEQTSAAFAEIAPRVMFVKKK